MGLAGGAGPAGLPCLLAIDAGNSKTDVALVTAAGAVLARGRGAGFRPHALGAEQAVTALGPVVSEVLADAAPARPALLAAYLANADLPVEEERLRAALAGCGWAPRVVVGNDTFAVLRTGTAEPRGVAVVCGAGINCVGLVPDGRTARFPALGWLTGDWGGGAGLAEEVIWRAVRAEDGRGPRTALAAAAARHFGRATAGEVAIAVHLGELPRDRLAELVPVLFAHARDGDAVARSIVERQAHEVALLARLALQRLDLLSEPTDVVLGGRVLTSGHHLLISTIAAELARTAPLGRLRVLDATPIVGAALLGLRALSGEPSAAVEARLRAAFSRN